MKKRGGKDPRSYARRDYRLLAADGLISSFVKIKDTDLHILADREVTDPAFTLTLQYRLQIETYIRRYPDFLSSLIPLAGDDLAPPIVKEMLAAGSAAGVGPMAAVAGAIAEAVGRGLQREGCREVIVENGGDIYLNRLEDCTVAIFAGASPLSLKVGLRLAAARMPLAVCTSSGTVGHSLSFGEADAVAVVAASTSLADAVATRIANEVKRQADGAESINRALELGRSIDGIYGVVIICGEKIGAVGEIELVNVS
jgi:uncharacterized protein